MNNLRCPIALTILIVAFAALAGCKKTFNSSPSCSIIDPIQQVSILKEDSLKVSVSASDPDGSIRYVGFYLDFKLYFRDDSPPYECLLKNIGFGYHQLSAIAYDDQDAKSSTSSLSVRVIPNEKVSVSLTCTPGYEYLLVGDTITCTANAISSEGAIKNTMLFINDSLVGQSATLPYYFVWKYIPPGTYRIYASAVDEKKHEGMSQVSDYSVSQNRPPTISISLINHNETVPYMPGEYIDIDCEVQDPDYRMGKVEYYLNNVLVKTVAGPSFYDCGFDQLSGGNYQVTARAYDQQGAMGVSNTLNVVVSPGLFRNGVISAMTYSEDDHVVFATDKTNKRLLILDPVNHLISDSLDLPYPNPLAITYSMQDKLLYIVHEFNGYVSVYDKQSKQLSEIHYSDILKGRDVAVDPIHRRIYVLSQDFKLVIIDADSHSVIHAGSPIEGFSLAMDPQARMLYAGGDYNAEINKYSVATEVAQLIQTVDAGMNGHKLNINPEHTTLVLPCGGGNGNDGYKIYAYDAGNLENIKGKWNIGSYPTFAVFSQDNQRLFVLNGSDEEVMIESISIYSMLSQHKFPNADDSHSIITPNYSGSVLTCFSYDSYYNNKYVIYFITP